MSPTLKAGERPQPFLFDDLVPGVELGQAIGVYDESMTFAWRRLFGQSTAPGAEAAGIAVALMMRGYLSVVSPRPPGNVHVGQGLRLHALPQAGEQVRTVLACTSKEIRRERRFVEFSATATGQNERPLFDGQLTLVWAA